MPLSSKQADVVASIKASELGRYVIKACPGSGKTFTIAHLLTQELGGWGSERKGIAVLSFTNKASEEVLNKFEGHQSANKLQAPHFVGTFDKFFNQNVFLPFARNCLSLSKEPTLVGEPFGRWKGLRLKWSGLLFEHIDYRVDGTLTDPPLYRAGMNGAVYARNKAAILQMKRIVNARGFFTQRDALFYAKEILVSHPEIGTLLAKRYPYLIIDEAQDSSDITMALVDILIGYGVKKVVVVGDPDQAIYEWNNARPGLFWDKWEDPTWTKLELDESYRSSDPICRLASAFSRVTEFSAADLNDCKDFSAIPVVRGINISGYDSDPAGVLEAVGGIKRAFLDDCIANGIEINKSNVAILCRSTADLHIIREIESPAIAVDWSKCEKLFTFELCSAKYLFEIAKHDSAYKHWLKYKLHQNSDLSFVSVDDLNNYEDANDGRRLLFKKAMEELKALSPIEGDNIKNWVLRNIPSETKYNLLPEIDFETAFFQLKDEIDNTQPLYSTIHGIKGATFDAVLLFLKKKGASGVHYKTYVNSESASLKDANTEEMRIAYVAMTRPRKLLTIGVPEDDLTVWQTKFSELLT